MGHYSSDYEYEHRKQRQQTQEELKRFSQDLLAIMPKVPSCVPARFLDNLGDLYNWVVLRSGKN